MLDKRPPVDCYWEEEGPSKDYSDEIYRIAREDIKKEDVWKTRAFLDEGEAYRPEWQQLVQMTPQIYQ